jgi:hypothetical protein
LGVDHEAQSLVGEVTHFPPRARFAARDDKDSGHVIGAVTVFWARRGVVGVLVGTVLIRHPQ